MAKVRGSVILSRVKATLLIFVSLAPVASAGELHYSFPSDRPIGRLYIRGRPVSDGAFTNLFSEDRGRLLARGEVTVPDDSTVDIILTKEGAADLSFLGRLPAGGMHSVQLSGVVVDRKMLQAIAATPSLIALRFHSCQFTEDAFQDAPPLPDLIYVLLTAPTLSAERQEEFAAWMARCPRLEFLRTEPALRLGSLKILKGHPSLNFLNLDINGTSALELEALTNLTNLRGLTLDVSNDVSAEMLGKLAELPQLVLINWAGGRVEGSVLKELAIRNCLKTLRLNRVDLADDFDAGLQQLTGLRELKIQAEDNAADADVLSRVPKALIALKELRRWPTLQKPGQEALQQLAECEQIESLSISGIAETVTPAELAAWDLSRLGELRDLTLADVPVDDAWVAKLSACTNLKRLTLERTRISGSAFRQLTSLEHLQFISLALHPEVPFDFSELASLPNLKELRLVGEFSTSSLEPLRRCQELRTLRVFGGSIDDSTTAWIAELPKLIRLELDASGGCLIGDQGACSLSRLKTLQELTLNAPLLSLEGTKCLLANPSLRSARLELNLTTEELEELHQGELSVPDISLSVTSSDLRRGNDGFLRRRPEETKAELDALEGKPVPEFSVPDDTGMEAGLESLRGKVVLIDFWATWCYPCTSSFPRLKDLNDRYHDRGLEIVAVHLARGAAEAPEYLQKQPLPWRITVDRDGTIAPRYAVQSIPAYYLVDRTGTLRVAGVSPYGLEEAIRRLLDEDSTDQATSVQNGSE